MPPSCCVALLCRPTASETKTTTAAVPMITPIAVSATRALRRPRFSRIKASRSNSLIRLAFRAGEDDRRADRRRGDLWRPLGEDRLALRRAAIEAEEAADESPDLVPEALRLWLGRPFGPAARFTAGADHGGFDDFDGQALHELLGLVEVIQVVHRDQDFQETGKVRDDDRVQRKGQTWVEVSDERGVVAELTQWPPHLHLAQDGARPAQVDDLDREDARLTHDQGIRWAVEAGLDHRRQEDEKCDDLVVLITVATQVGV